MPSLKWLHSYETIKFNTSDGDLHKGQYGVSGDKIYIRDTPENNSNFKHLDPDGLMTKEEKDAFLAGLERVDVIPGEYQYFNEFALPNGRRLRIRSTQKKYKDLGKVGALPRAERVVSAADIVEIVKDDDKWQ